MGQKPRRYEVNQTDADTLPAVACEAHPKIGGFSRGGIALRAPAIALSWRQSSATMTTGNVIDGVSDSCGRALGVREASSARALMKYRFYLKQQFVG